MSEKFATDINVGDTIYRQQAIDAIAEELNRINIHVQNVAIARIRDRLNKLPSAQPEIIRCKDCKFAINADTDMMCGNPKSWVVATENDFGCILAERRTDE